MTTYTAVTTFSPEGFDIYGRRFVESFLEHWPIPLVVYHESQPDVSILHDRLTWLNLDHDVGRKAFIRAHGHDPQKVGTERDPNSQAIRFCHKVFAITNAAWICQSSADWLCWIDADVITKRAVTPQDLAAIMPDGKDLAFLGRRWMYTECGFVAYRLGSPQVRALLEDMRHYYTSGEIFTRPRKDWHDSRCFDICRERSAVDPSRWHNLTDPHSRLTHVWPASPLGRFTEHHKGPGRKRGAYGAITP